MKYAEKISLNNKIEKFDIEFPRGTWGLVGLGTLSRRMDI